MLRFVDAKCMIGRRNAPREGSPVIREDFLEIMDRCHIEKAVAHHAMAVEYDMMDGNHTLVEETAGSDRFLRQWCVMPKTFDEFLTPAELVAEMKKKDVKSVRLQPKTSAYSLYPYAIGELMEAMAECRVPVFMDAGESTWDGIYQLCTDYPHNTIVITSPGYRCARQLAPVLAACPNLRVGISNYVVHGGIATVCRHFGAERLLFESGMPVSSAAAAVSLVHYADISREEKAMIAAGNLESLLSEVTL